MASLIQPGLKVHQAKKHLDALCTEVRKYCDSHPHHFSTEENLTSNEWIVTASITLPPVVISLIAGDFIACLRSSLDYLVWQLACLKVELPSRETCFPICEKNTLDAQLKITKSTFQIPDDAVSIIKSLQPYQQGDDYKTSHLWQLHKLWNIEKHRHLTSHSVIADLPLPDGIEVPKWEWFSDKGVMRFPLSVKDKLPLNPCLPVQVIFEEKVEQISLTVEDFYTIYKHIDEVIFPQFVKFFSH